VTLLLFAVVAATGHVILQSTRWGRMTYAVGGNYNAALTSGLPVKRIRAATFVLTAFLAGVAGCALALTLATARPDYGSGYSFAAITGVVVGGTSLFGGSGNMTRTVVGLVLVGVVTNILSLHGAPTTQLGLPLGLLIVLAVGLDGYLRRRAGRS